MIKHSKTSARSNKRKLGGKNDPDRISDAANKRAVSGGYGESASDMLERDRRLKERKKSPHTKAGQGTRKKAAPRPRASGRAM